MPDYTLTVTFFDELNGTTTKRYGPSPFTDDAAANAAASALLSDIAALTTAGMSSAILGKEVGLATAADVGSRVFERVDATVSLVGKTQKANMDVPSPVNTIFAGNALVFGVANDWDDYLVNFQAGGGWTISDGDVVDATIKGKRTFAASGKTNLPT